MENLIGKRVTTDDRHSGIVIKHYKVTGGGMSVHIKQDDGRIWYCPDSNIAIIHKREDKKIITDKRALEVISRIYHIKTELYEQDIYPEIKILKDYIKQQKDIVKNALEIINYKKSEKEQVDEIYLYYFDKCATAERSDK